MGFGVRGSGVGVWDLGLMVWVGVRVRNGANGVSCMGLGLRVGVSDLGFRVDLLLLLLRECIVVERTLRTNRVFSQSSGY